MHVHVVDGLQSLFDHGCGISLTEPLVGQHVVVKIATSHQLRYDVEVDIILKHVLESDDIGMVSVPQHFQLLLHQLDQLLVLTHIVFPNYLQRTLLLGDQIPALVYLPESALAEHLSESKL